MQQTTSAPGALPFEGTPEDQGPRPLHSVRPGLMVSHFGLRVRVLGHNPARGLTRVEADAPGRGRMQLESSTLVVVLSWAEQADRHPRRRKPGEAELPQPELF